MAEFFTETVSMDFELGGAIKLIFPNSSIHLCLFHLVRNMRKKIG